MMASPALCTLVCFAALTALLAFTYANYRVALVLTGKAAPNAWTRDAQTWADPAFITRLKHAHLNCVESLPVYAALVLAAYATNQLAIIDGLAYVFLGLRVGQVLLHAISTSSSVVFVRANLWIAQCLIIGYWVLQLCGVITA